MSREVDLQTFVARHHEAFVVDVREPEEFQEGHVPGARNVPLDQVLAGGIGEIPAEPVYVVCASGNRSRHAADALAATGMNAFSVNGGTKAWASAGRPLETGRQ